MHTDKEDKKRQKEASRRQFLTETLPAAAGALVLAAGLGAYQCSAQAVPALAASSPGQVQPEQS
ncbi:MAG: hypothetical protein D3903_21900, partial [Candidatus Electrothrix sp. GM3_4]|nr:hypothetical protein [Candidatus Electrothrix sp. GM3_4]